MVINGEIVKNVLIFNYFINSKYNSVDKFFDWYTDKRDKYLNDTNKKYVVYTDNKDIINKFCIDDLILEYVDPNWIRTDNPNVNKFNKFLMFEDCIKKYCDSKTDYFIFIQSNGRCNGDICLEELIKEDKEISAPIHPIFRYTNEHFFHLYNNNAGTYYIDPKINKQLIYFQSGHVITKIDFILEFCRYYKYNLIYDMFNKNIAIWHDETYYNYYLNILKPQCVNILPPKYIDLEYSQNKRVYFISKLRNWWSK